jgi:AcrR family transcriptional regulator
MDIISDKKGDSIQIRIVKLAQQLFHSDGARKVTMDEIAHLIGKKRSSLYYYYTSKEEVLDAVINAEIAEIFRAVAGNIDDIDFFEKNIRTYFKCLTPGPDNKALFRLIDSGKSFLNHLEYGGISAMAYRLFRKSATRKLQKLLNSGMEKKLIRKIAHDELDTLIFVLFSSAQGIRELPLTNFSESEQVTTMLARMTINWLIQG